MQCAAKETPTTPMNIFIPVPSQKFHAEKNRNPARYLNLLSLDIAPPRCCGAASHPAGQGVGVAANKYTHALSSISWYFGESLPLKRRAWLNILRSYPRDLATLAWVICLRVSSMRTIILSSFVSIVANIVTPFS